MPHESHQQGSSEPGADSDQLWQGLPLDLERDDAEDETRPSRRATRVRVALPPPAAAVSVPGRLLSAWLLWTGAVSLAFAVAALVTALMHGSRPVGWRGPLLAFDAAVVILVLRSVVAGGVEAGQVCRRFVGGAGFAAAVAVMLGALLHVADRFIHGTLPGALLTELFAFGLLGLAGCVVFVACLRDWGWACRAAVLATAAFVPLVVLGAGPQFELFTAHDLLAFGLLRGHWPALAACGICGAGLVVSLEALNGGGRRSRLRWPLAALWLVLLLAAVAFVAFVTARTLGVGAACLRLWAAAGVWCAPALVALALAGMASCWGRRSSLADDAQRATDFAWWVVAAGGLALLAIRLAMGGLEGGVELFVVAGGVVAAMVIAWLTAGRGTWTGRWALLPVGSLAVGFACGLGALLELGGGMGVRRADVWNLGVTYLWCVVVVGLALALWGVLVRRYRARVEHPARALQEDLGLLTTAGCIASGACLAVALALLAGRADEFAGLRRALGEAGAMLRDVVILGQGRAVLDATARLAYAALHPWPERTVLAIAAALAAAILMLHVLARAGVRWGLWAVAFLWAGALTVGSAFCVLYATGLFLPLPVPGLTTPAGRFLEAHFAARLALMVVLAGLMTRFWEAAVSAVRSARAPERSRWPAWPSRSGWESPHLRFLVASGAILSAAGLGMALLMNLHPRLEAAVFEWTGLARSWSAAALALGLRIGQAVRIEPACAAAAAVIAYALLLIHEEARNGRAAVYPLLATVWVGSLAPWVCRLVVEVRGMPDPPMPGRIAALAAAGALLAMLAAAAVVVMKRWWDLRRTGNLDDPDQSASAGLSRAAAGGLGTLGLGLTLIGCLIVLHGALRGKAGYGPFAGELGAAAVALRRVCASQVASVELFLMRRGNLGFAVPALGVAAALLLVLHFLAGYRTFVGRSALYSVWFAAALAGVVAIGVMVSRHPLGTWTAGRVLAALLLGAFVLRLVAALASPGGWLVRRSQR